MKELGFIMNWRADVFVALVCVVMLLLMMEAESVTGMLATKVAAAGVGYVAYRLYKRWDARGLMEEIKN